MLFTNLEMQNFLPRVGPFVRSTEAVASGQQVSGEPPSLSMYLPPPPLPLLPQTGMGKEGGIKRKCRGEGRARMLESGRLVRPTEESASGNRPVGTTHLHLPTDLHCCCSFSHCFDWKRKLEQKRKCGGRESDRHCSTRQSLLLHPLFSPFPALQMGGSMPGTCSSKGGQH